MNPGARSPVPQQAAGNLPGVIKYPINKGEHKHEEQNGHG